MVETLGPLIELCLVLNCFGEAVDAVYATQGNFSGEDGPVETFHGLQATSVDAGCQWEIIFIFVFRFYFHILFNLTSFKRHFTARKM